MNIKNRECPLCGSKRSKKICSIKNTMTEDERLRTNYPTDYSIVVCEQCGMSYTDINIQAEDIDTYYTKYNMYSNISGVKSNLYLKTMDMYFESISKYITPNAKIVDVGCGSGDLLERLMNKGYPLVSGIDPSKSSIECLNEKGVSGQVGTVYSCDINSDDKYDLVISTGVLEHLLFPQDALRHMKELLSKDGYMYICIPAAEKYKDDVQPVANYFNHEHINHFTENTLMAMAKNIGMSVVESKIKKACDEIEAALNVILKVDDDLCGEDGTIRYDSSGCESIEKYFDAIKNIELKNELLLNEIVGSGKGVIVWGTGNYASSMMNKYPELKNSISFFVDNNEAKNNTLFYEKMVYKPEKIRFVDQDVIVVVCVMQSKEEVKKDIEKLGIDNKVIYF